MRTKIPALIRLLLAAFCFAPFVAGAAGGKPNIIFIEADDVGIGDIHCSGGPFTTPNIDALAQGGTRFQFCYATPLCGPSRCQALTGRYPFRTGLNSCLTAFRVSPSREVMIPTVMKTAGYASASVGKWGQISHDPRTWGFDEQLVAETGGYTSAQTPTYDVNGTTVTLPPGAYLPDIMHNFAVDFIRRHSSQPFFLYYPMLQIHIPIVPTPDSRPGANAAALYADNIAYMDKLVGKLVSELNRLNLRQNTVIIFTGDNGSAPHGLPPYVFPSVDGRTIDGWKSTMLEGGSRVPLIVNWPGTTPPGVVNRDLIDFSDFFATFAQLGGAALPAGVTLDSRSFAPQIRGAQGTPRDWVYVELLGKSYVRDARYKLTNTGGFFDLAGAPWTELPVAATSMNAGLVAEHAWLKAVLDAHPAIQPIVTCDFDGDGHPDILMQNMVTGERRIAFIEPFQMKIKTWYTDPVTGVNKFSNGMAGLGVVDPSWRIAGTGDFNGDGKPDIVWENTVTAQRVIWFMNGATRTGAADLSGQKGVVGTAWKIAGIGDFNGDGKPDIVWQNTTTGERVIRFMNGANHTGTAVLSNAGVEGTAWKIVGVGDFNRDGKPDLVWQNTTSGRINIHFMDGATTTRVRAVPSRADTPWPRWRLASVADYNGDGNSDLLFQDTSTGKVSVWLMNGAARGSGNRTLIQDLTAQWQICN